MKLYLGIDGGGSHTRARLVAEDGAGSTVLGSGEAGPANTPDGLPQALLVIEDVCRKAVADAGLGEADLPRIKAGLGIAGLNRRGFLDGLKAHPFPFEWTRLASDASIAQLGAFGGGDGAIVIVGTGSVGFARVQGEVITIGGYGFPVSDEGSGAELGLRAVRRALWARDGRIQHSGLTEQVLDRFHGSAGEIVDWTSRARPKDYATFAPLVMDLAEQGDPIAEQIVQESALRLDRLIHALIDRGAEQCCLMGGVAERISPWLAVSIRERLRDPQGDALDGAILLAHGPSEPERI